MRFIFTFILLCILASVFSQENIHIAYYGKRMDKPMADSSKVSAEAYDIINQLESRIRQRLPEVEYQLLFNQTESLFFATERLSQGNDNIFKLAQQNLGGEGEIVYCHYGSKIRLSQHKAFGKHFLVTDSIRTNMWELENETKKIGNFNCFKATSIISVEDAKIKERKVTAWYTLDIPFSTGPFGYTGLPGFIVEYSVLSDTYFLKQLELNPRKKLKIEIPTKGKPLTRKEYDEWVRNNVPSSFGP
jgi:GLPGLI family protein